MSSTSDSTFLKIDSLIESLFRDFHADAIALQGYKDEIPYKVLMDSLK